MAFDIWLQQDGKMERLFEGARHFFVVCCGENDATKMQARTNYEADDTILKKMYYSLEEHLRQRNVLPPLPTPQSVKAPLGNMQAVSLATEVYHE